MRRRRTPRETTPSDAAAYERAGQQPLPGFDLLPQRPTAAQRVRARALAITEYTAKIFQEVPSQISVAQAQPPLAPDLRHTPRTLSKLEWTAIVVQWALMFLIICVVVYRADPIELPYVKMAKLPRLALVGVLGCAACLLGALTSFIYLRFVHSLFTPRVYWLYRLMHFGAAVLITFVLLFPSIVSVVFAREGIASFVGDAFQNLKNEFTHPTWGEPKVQGPRR